MLRESIANSNHQQQTNNLINAKNKFKYEKNPPLRY